MSQVDPTELSEDELEERRQRLKDAVEEEAAGLESAEENALETLAAATEAEGDDFSTVELTGGIEVEVKDTLPGRLEKEAATIQDDDAEAAYESVYAVMAELIQSPDGFASVGVWREYHDEYGTTYLMENAVAVSNPYWERQKELEDQRQFRRQ